MDSRIISLYDEYTHAPLPRTTFLSRLAELAGGKSAAEALLPKLENNYAEASTVAPDDPRLVTGAVTFSSGEEQVMGYLARPKEDGKRPGVVVIHENRGLNAHIEDVARRAAASGFLALAPNALSPFGGTPDDEDEARNLIGQLDAGETLQRFLAAVTYLKDHDECSGKVGCVGFCWGGAMANQLAVHSPDVQASVPFYGRQASAEDAARIQASLLLQYGEHDERINAGIADYEAALKTNGVEHTIHIYEGCHHAFHNDTSESRYNAVAAHLAWQRTVDFLHEKLGG